MVCRCWSSTSGRFYDNAVNAVRACGKAGLELFGVTKAVGGWQPPGLCCQQVPWALPILE